MEKINKLAGILRYVGLNINPLVLEVILTLSSKLDKGGLTLDEIDAIVAAIEAKGAEVSEPEEVKPEPTKKPKLQKK